MKRILFIHGSADLYGASKVFLAVIKGLDRQRIEPIVLLPYRESLDKELSDLGVKVMIGPVAVLRRQMANPAGVCLFFSDLVKSLFLIRKIDREYRPDAIYTNLSPVLSGALYAKLFGKIHIWHTHEIITKPAFIKYLMPRLIRYFSDVCIANSRATKKYVMSGGMKDEDIKVVYNGIPELQRSGSGDLLPARTDKVTVGMIGRFNWLKGQEVFVRAAQKAIAEGYDLRFLITGSAFRNEEYFVAKTKSLISQLKLEGSVQVLDFVRNIADLYDRLDIVAIPSTQPESFGMVAVEAMSMKKPVIASNIGALPEVVADGETGLLVEPGNVLQLKDAIVKLARDEGLRKKMGEAGFKRQQERFTEERFQREINETIKDII